MHECSKSVLRRLYDPGFTTKYFRGAGVDIGGAPDPLSLYVDLFPLLENVRTWDMQDGDAQYMNGVPDGSYDLVHASHCLEHMVDPAVAIEHWTRICREDGYIVITVPDEDLFEQEVFPSTFNADHKWTFTTNKATTWSPRSINVLDLIAHLNGQVAVERLQLVDHTYRYALPRLDQTKTYITESAIELVLRKRPQTEVTTGRRRRGPARLSDEMIRHLNQSIDDWETLKRANAGKPPFQNDTPLA